MPLITALSGVLSSRLPVRGRQESLPDQTAAAIHRGAQEAPLQETARLSVLRAPPQPRVTARFHPRSPVLLPDPSKILSTWNLNPTEIKESVHDP